MPTRKHATSAEPSAEDSPRSHGRGWTLEIMRRRRYWGGLAKQNPLEFARWRNMMGRCYKTTHCRYHTHGGRGIKVWEHWHDFRNFHEDMKKLGNCPPGCSLDRIDNDGDYVPGNVRWASPAEQASNRRTNIRLNVQGKSVAISELAKQCGINLAALRYRIKTNRSIDDILRAERLTVINMVGMAIGRLTVIGRDSDRHDGGKTFWLCRCVCGEIRSISGRDLRREVTQSCGCLQRECAAALGRSRKKQPA